MEKNQNSKRRFGIRKKIGEDQWRDFFHGLELIEAEEWRGNKYVKYYYVGKFSTDLQKIEDESGFDLRVKCVKIDNLNVENLKKELKDILKEYWNEKEFGIWVVHRLW